VRRVCRNVNDGDRLNGMRWTAAAMQEAAKGFRRLKAHKTTSSVTCRSGSTSPKGSTHGVLARQAAAA